MYLYKYENNLSIENDKTNFTLSTEADKGKEKYILTNNNELIHTSVVFNNSLLLNAYGYNKPYKLIGDCYTNEKYRGQSIYPNMLKYIAEKCKSENTIYILVEPQNISSVKGIEKANYSRIAHIECKRFLIFNYSKKKYEV